MDELSNDEKVTEESEKTVVDVKIDDAVFSGIEENINGLIEKIEEKETVQAERDESLNELIEIFKEKEQSEIEEKNLMTEKEKEDMELAELEKEKESEAIASDENFRESIMQQISGGQDINSEQMDMIIDRLDTIILQNEEVSTADHLIGIYGMIVFPGLLILYALSRMIKPFI